MFGRFVFPNGDYYEGEYINTSKGIVRHGEGKYFGTFRSQSKNAEDQVQESLLMCIHSPIASSVSDMKLELEEQLTTLVEELKLGNYSGSWQNDTPEGTGKAHFASGSVYTGNFVDGKMHGEGTFRWSNGYILKGEFEKNRLLIGSTVAMIDPQGHKWTGIWNGDNQSKILEKVPRGTIPTSPKIRTRLRFKLIGF